ncbi:MAG: TIGR04348 family glycosyltransferase [Herminiimonas sp.]|nr:TIGR04348 family glycosyltransferase [Herminiimonas sp.]
MQSNKPQVVIISPALANANNGNWQTARRWASYLRCDYRVACMMTWDPEDALTASPDLMIALHARRSADSIDAYARRFPQRPLVVILTGTDLYRDIRTDASAQRSLELATRIVVLQAAGLDELAPHLRAKATVIHQSAPSLKPFLQAAGSVAFDVIMIGHLREEKRPATFIDAAQMVSAPHVRLLHVGAALDLALGALAADTQANVARYRWLGPMPHAQTRQRLKRCALMVITSEMEGGANVIIEAVTSGAPVIASDIAGNRGMLGEGYAGYFPLGDSAALARLIDRAATDPVFHATLKEQCAARAALFAPAIEKTAVRELVDNQVHLSTLTDGHP